MELDIDKTLLQEIKSGIFSFTEMVKLLRRVWVVDVDAMFEVVFEDDETIASMLLLKTGVWEENKCVLQHLKQNKDWWDVYFIERQPDNIYVFRKPYVKVRGFHIS